MRIAKLGWVLALGVLASVGWAEEWPKWRGPEGDGISREKDLLQTWPAEGLKKLWSAKVGQGYSSPIGVGGKVYLFSLVAKKDTLTAYSAPDGKELWTASYDGGYTGQYPGTRATPVVEGDRIYTYGGAGDLVCRNLADGKQIWKTNVVEGGNLQWGVASSPLVVGETIYVQGGKGPAAVAVKKSDGSTIWKSALTGGGYAQEILVDVQGTRQLIVFSADAVNGLNPETGKTIWSEPWKTQYAVNATTPVYADGKLLVSSAYKQGAMMLELSPAGARKLWETKDVQSHFQQMILDRGVLFANSVGTLKALQWPENKVLWSEDLKLGNGGSLVRNADRLIALSDSGKLMLLDATEKGAKVVSSFQAFKGKEIWSTPLVYQGKLYVKGPDELVCYDLSGK